MLMLKHFDFYTLFCLFISFFDNIRLYNFFTKKLKYGIILIGDYYARKANK